MELEEGQIPTILSNVTSESAPGADSEEVQD